MPSKADAASVPQPGFVGGRVVGGLSRVTSDNNDRLRIMGILEEIGPGVG